MEAKFRWMIDSEGGRALRRRATLAKERVREAVATEVEVKVSRGARCVHGRAMLAKEKAQEALLQPVRWQIARRLAQVSRGFGWMSITLARVKLLLSELGIVFRRGFGILTSILSVMGDFTSFFAFCNFSLTF